MSSLLLGSFVAILTLLSTKTFAQTEGSVDGLTLKLIDAEGRTITTTETNEDGAWSLAIPQAGTYTIVVDEGEFAEARTDIGEKIPDAVFHVASNMVAVSGTPVTIGWSMKDIPWIRCYAAPRDPSTGLANGDKKYKAVQFIKEFDRSVAILECKQAGTTSGTVSFTVRK
ncbi:MAG TPA: hypothetical protein VFH43_11650 [Candidatus Kapabacteria bacterium]|nr:hypothetical protein [Candidatus Kapabacteria bacterium]